jgi:hypothetical protein
MCFPLYFHNQPFKKNIHEYISLEIFFDCAVEIQLKKGEKICAYSPEKSGSDTVGSRYYNKVIGFSSLVALY